MTMKSLLSMEVGGPRIDSTCFFDIPSWTSSTLALVMRVSLQEFSTSSITLTSSVAAIRGINAHIDMFWRRLSCSKIRVFAFHFVILESDNGELFALLVSINCFVEENHVLAFHFCRWTENCFHLRLGHTGCDLIVIRQNQLRPRQRIAIASGYCPEGQSHQHCHKSMEFLRIHRSSVAFAHDE